MGIKITWQTDVTVWMRIDTFYCYNCGGLYNMHQIQCGVINLITNNITDVWISHSAKLGTDRMKHNDWWCSPQIIKKCTEVLSSSANNPHYTWGSRTKPGGF